MILPVTRQNIHQAAVIHSENWGFMYCPIRSGQIIPILLHNVCPCFPLCSFGVCLRIGLKS